MQAPKKKSMIAAAAAPFALTLALGAPAYASGNTPGQPNDQATANANTKSTTNITVEDCVADAHGKEISYIQYLDGDTQVAKDPMSSETATLRTDIAYTTVVVKAGTSVERFEDLTCSVPEATTPTTEDKTEDKVEDKVEDKTEDKTEDKVEDETEDKVEHETEGGAEVETDEEENVAGGRDNDNNNRDGNSDTVAGAEASAGADVSGNVSSEVQGNASAGTPEAGGDAVLGAEGETQAYQPTAADGSTQYLPNTGAEENAALIAGGAGLAGFGAWMMLKRRRFGLER